MKYSAHTVRMQGVGRIHSNVEKIMSAGGCFYPHSFFFCRESPSIFALRRSSATMRSVFDSGGPQMCSPRIPHELLRRWEMEMKRDVVGRPALCFVSQKSYCTSSSSHIKKEIWKEGEIYIFIAGKSSNQCLFTNAEWKASFKEIEGKMSTIKWLTWTRSWSKLTFRLTLIKKPDQLSEKNKH